MSEFYSCSICGSNMYAGFMCPKCSVNGLNPSESKLTITPSNSYLYIEPGSEAKIIMQQQEKINELTHKNEVLMDSYLESETINDKGELVGSLEYFRKRIAELEEQNLEYQQEATQFYAVLDGVANFWKDQHEKQEKRIVELELQLKSYKLTFLFNY